MIMTTFNSQKYAKTLLEIAKEQDKVREVLSEVCMLIETFDEQKLSFDNLSDLVKNFLDTVKNNGDLPHLKEILEKVKKLGNGILKISNVEVVSVVPLNNEQMQKIVQLSKLKFNLDEVVIINNIDSKIIGGFIINSCGKVIDTSIKTQLEKIASLIL